MNKNVLISKLTRFTNDTWSSSKKITHSHMGVWEEYPCANPDGPVDNSDCDEDEPLCNCPCQELKPDSDEEVERINQELNDGLGGFWRWWFDLWGYEIPTVSKDDLKEPTKEEIKEAKESIKECELIKSAEGLGEEYLGCLWTDLEHPSSCNCPCVGKKFGEYLEYTNTYSTYWDTPPQQPLWRNAQMMLVTSQKSLMIIHGDLTLRPGTLIYIKEPKATEDKEKRLGGRWLVAGIQHRIGNFPHAHAMDISLVRDTAVFDPNGDTNVFESIWEFIKDLL